MHMELEEGLDANCVKAELDNGEMILSEDSAKVQARRNAKLGLLRQLRAEKLAAVDRMINELALDVRSDKEEVKNLRQALLDLTDDYKKVDGNAKASIDNLDLSEIEWPEL